METLSSESFIQKHLQTYLWSWKHTEDRLYLLKVMLINFLTLQTTKLLKCKSSLCRMKMAKQRTLLIWHMLLKEFSAEEMYITI